MSSRRHDRQRDRAHRNLRRQHRRVRRSIARDPNAELWVGFWSSLDDLLLEYAKAGVANTLREHLAHHPNTKRETLTHALRLAEGEWRERTVDRDQYAATMEALLAAGADASVLPADLVDVLPTLRARAFNVEFPPVLEPARTRCRL